jgi:type II secretory pathway pseudopilin PulG
MRTGHFALLWARRPRGGRPSSGWRGLVRTGRFWSRDDGFSLVEIAVASGVMSTALVMLAGVMTSGLVATGYSRERQSANQLANQALEQIRALPFNTMKAGLGSTDLAGGSDAEITGGCGGTYCFGGERVAYGNNLTVDPLVPHQKNVTIGVSTFTVSSYVTYYENNTGADTRRVTVGVTWTGGLKPGTRNVQVQTIIFSPSSCLSLDLHPISGPCQGSFTAASLQSGATVNITGTVGGLGLDHATLSAGLVTADQNIEQISKVDGLAQASGATIQATGQSESAVGRATVSSRADNDPGGPASVYESKGLPAQAAASQSLTAGSDSLTVSETGGDSGGTTSTTSSCTGSCASPPTPNPRNCPNISGFANENDSLQCSGASSRTAATISAVASLGALGTIDMGSISSQANPTVAITDRKTASGGTTCPTTSGDGCVRAQFSRAAHDMSAGGLPSNETLGPAGFDYFAQVLAVADSVSVETGVGSTAPSATQSSGSVRVWCAQATPGDALCPTAGYVTKPFNQITTTLTTPTLTITDPALAGGTTITMSATITAASTPTTSSCTGTCTRTAATAKSVPPIVTLSYTIVSGGSTVLDSTLVLDPGTLTAQATYAIAPT